LALPSTHFGLCPLVGTPLTDEAATRARYQQALEAVRAALAVHPKQTHLLPLSDVRTL
jgi:hypothetical protein